MRKTHGESQTRLFSIWQRIRGENKHDLWGRKSVHEDWLNNFLTFKSWAISSGYSDTYVLKRKDKYRGYTPENCYWGPRYSYNGNSDSLVNRTFGKLTVIREVLKSDRKSGRRAYVCRCECGNEATVLANNLLSGATKSCGCLRNRARTFAVSSTGDIRVGRLTILERMQDGDVCSYRCLCDCGKMLAVPAASLMDGSVKSCGCSLTVQEQPPVQPSQPPNPLEGWDNF